MEASRSAWLLMQKWQEYGRKHIAQRHRDLARRYSTEPLEVFGSVTARIDRG